jgi:hypothetical protein
MREKPSARLIGAPPIPPSWTVREGRDAYLRDNGFSVEAYDARWTPASILGVRFHVPNTARHRWAIMLHDLHHVATGYPTDLVGEAEVSAWECRAGLAPLGLYTGAIVLGLALLGLLVAPRRTLGAWRASRRRSLFQSSAHSYDEILAMTVGDLRRLLAVPERGLTDPREPGG